MSYQGPQVVTQALPTGARNVARRVIATLPILPYEETVIRSGSWIVFSGPQEWVGSIQWDSQGVRYDFIGGDTLEAPARYTSYSIRFTAAGSSSLEIITGDGPIPRPAIQRQPSQQQRILGADYVFASASDSGSLFRPVKGTTVQVVNPDQALAVIVQARLIGGRNYVATLDWNIGDASIPTGFTIQFKNESFEYNYSVEIVLIFFGNELEYNFQYQEITTGNRLLTINITVPATQFIQASAIVAAFNAWSSAEQVNVFGAVTRAGSTNVPSARNGNLPKQTELNPSTQLEVWTSRADPNRPPVLRYALLNDGQQVQLPAAATQFNLKTIGGGEMQAGVLVVSTAQAEVIPDNP